MCRPSRPHRRRPDHRRSSDRPTMVVLSGAAIAHVNRRVRWLKKGGKASGSNQAAAAQSVIESVNAEVASEIARTIDYFKSTVTEGEVRQVLLCGGGAQIAGLVRQLRDRMHAVVEVANPFAEVDTSGSDFDQAALADLAPMASVGVGLALRSVGDR